MMLDCWNDEPKQRPQFSKISVFFQEMLNDVGSKVGIPFNFKWYNFF